MKKIISFFKGFIQNITADPVSSIKGAVQITAGSAAIYGMVTGTVPMNAATAGFAGTAITSGVHALGIDTTKKEG